MAKKWTNEKIDDRISERTFVRITDVTNLLSPSTTKIKWCCKICSDEWFSSVDSVVRGSGCPTCAGNKKYTIPELQQVLNDTNRNIRVLSLAVGSVNHERKGVFECNVCGHNWTAILSNITHKKQGCPRCGKCGRYNEHSIRKIHNIPGKLYLIECVDEHEHFIKIGITKRNVKNRYTNVDFSYNIVDTIEFDMPMLKAWQIEQHILTTNTFKKYTPLKRFGGKNECIEISFKPHILSTIKEILQHV